MRILHLYYDLMNLYGDYGNVVVLKKHLTDQGLEVEVDKKTLNDEIDFNNYDFIYCGSGTEKNQLIALKDLLKRKDNFVKATDKAVILFTGNAMELLGTSIDDNEALNLVDMKTVSSKDRYTGDVILNNKDFGEVVGFINKCTSITTDKDNSLFTYIFKDNTLNDGEVEGFRFKNCFGTHVIGPVLVKNPNFMKYIVKMFVSDYKEIVYLFEEDSYNVTLKALKERMK
ncbi:MAG: hypothetical protein Q4B60_03510 [Erysipelotrichaceae bacterium]|nr:hypothetical protein [Erysipelotrichaceae bacterium]